MFLPSRSRIAIRQKYRSDALNKGGMRRAIPEAARPAVSAFFRDRHSGELIRNYERSLIKQAQIR